MGVPGDAIDRNDQETVALALSAGGVATIVIGGMLGSRLLRIVGLGSAVAGSVHYARMELAERSEKIEAAEGRSLALDQLDPVARARSSRTPPSRRSSPDSKGRRTSRIAERRPAEGARSWSVRSRPTEYESSARLVHAVRTVGDGDATEDRHPLERQHWCVRVVLRGGSDIDSSGEGLRLRLDSPTRRDLERDPAEEAMCAEACPGASSASRRSNAMPPNQASADPPLKPFARLFRSMPSNTATSVSSSLSSSPREGKARLMNAAAANIPTHAPSLKTRSVRSGRIKNELTPSPPNLHQASRGNSRSRLSCQVSSGASRCGRGQRNRGFPGRDRLRARTRRRRRDERSHRARPIRVPTSLGKQPRVSRVQPCSSPAALSLVPFDEERADDVGKLGFFVRRVASAGAAAARARHRRRRRRRAQISRRCRSPGLTSTPRPRRGSATPRGLLMSTRAGAIESVFQERLRSGMDNRTADPAAFGVPAA